MGGDALRPGLDEAWLPQRQRESLLRQDRRRRLERRDARRVEVDARLEVDLEMPIAAQEIPVLPADVKMCFEPGGVELESTAQQYASKPLLAHLDDEVHHRLRVGLVAELGNDVDRSKSTQGQRGFLGVLDGQRRVGIAGIDVDRLAEWSLGELL